MTSVRTATFDLWRERGLTTMFANPGSTEIPLLADLPQDFRFVLGLHEGAVVGMATGWALGRGTPALVNLHTVAGLGNAVGALATARQSRAPLVVVVGMQDRRHLALEPFLSGPLADLAGSYPVWVDQPARAQDVPGAIARAYHEAAGPTPGPALVLVPMDDWAQPCDDATVIAAPRLLWHALSADPQAVAEVARRLRAATAPAIVAGAGADDPGTWSALVAIAGAVGATVWQEALGHRAGFPQDSPRFAGYLPPSRSGVRATLAAHDLVLVVGAPAFRQYPFEPGELLPGGLTVVQVTADPHEAGRAVADVSILAPVAPFCTDLARTLDAPIAPLAAGARTPVTDVPAGTDAMRPADVFAALAQRLPRDVVLVEESPSSGPLLRQMIPARMPGGRFSAAGGGLGFAIPAAVGLRMANPHRPVVCIVGDGSSLYTVQALWSAVQYRAGVLFVVLANGRYAIMDRLASELSPGTQPAWPSFENISVARIARGFGCPARRVSTLQGLVGILDQTLEGLAGRSEPLLLEVAVTASTG